LPIILAIAGFSKYRNSTLAALAEGALMWFVLADGIHASSSYI